MIQVQMQIKIDRNGAEIANGEMTYEASEMSQISLEIVNITRPRINKKGLYGVQILEINAAPVRGQIEYFN